jgi:GT2 family glycosyltransferase
MTSDRAQPHADAHAQLRLHRPVLVSFLISTFNRRNVLLQTLKHLQACGLRDEDHEVLVVDNASTDGTSDAVLQQCPHVRLFALKQNRGACAKNIALPHVRGTYVVFLDDDSFPAPGAVERMMHHFATDAKLGAAVFTVTLPDGSRECSAYPDVFIGCGTGLRRSALDQVGGLPEDFFMQAEEYDLSLRLLDAGWRVRTFDDLHVTHLKTPGARSSQRTTRLDVRNNLLLATRHFPDRWVFPFAWDWMRRYYFIAAAKGHRWAYMTGLLSGIARVVRDVRRRPVSDETFEQFSRLEQTQQRMARAQRAFALQRVLFIDLGKNILPFWKAARACGMEVVAIADNRLAGKRRYRGIPIITDNAARELEFDAAIVSNLSPVHAAARREAWRRLDDRPVIDLFEVDEPTAFISARRAAAESRRIAARSA